MSSELIEMEGNRIVTWTFCRLLSYDWRKEFVTSSISHRRAYVSFSFWPPIGQVQSHVASSSNSYLSTRAIALLSPVCLSYLPFTTRSLIQPSCTAHFPIYSPFRASYLSSHPLAPPTPSFNHPVTPLIQSPASPLGPPLHHPSPSVPLSDKNKMNVPSVALLSSQRIPKESLKDP